MFSIVINRRILEMLGMSDADIATLHAEGLAAGGVIVADCFSFDAAGERNGNGPSQSDRLATVADPDRSKRSLLLVGISDRYGAGKKFSEWVREIGVLGHGPEALTEVERDRLAEALWGIHASCVIPLRVALDRASAAARSLRTRERDYVVVTRHKALLQLLRERGHVGDLVTVIEHATEADVSGRHVIGILPMRMAALCATYSECSLILEEDDRGVSDLPIERLRQIAQPLTQYRVSQVPPHPDR